MFAGDQSVLGLVPVARTTARATTVSQLESRTTNRSPRRSTAVTSCSLRSSRAFPGNSAALSNRDST